MLSSSSSLIVVIEDYFAPWLGATIHGKKTNMTPFFSSSECRNFLNSWQHYLDTNLSDENDAGEQFVWSYTNNNLFQSFQQYYSLHFLSNEKNNSNKSYKNEKQKREGLQNIVSTNDNCCYTFINAHWLDIHHIFWKFLVDKMIDSDKILNENLLNHMTKTQMSKNRNNNNCFSKHVTHVFGVICFYFDVCFSYKNYICSLSSTLEFMIEYLLFSSSMDLPLCYLRKTTITDDDDYYQFASNSIHKFMEIILTFNKIMCHVMEWNTSFVNILGPQIENFYLQLRSGLNIMNYQHQRQQYMPTMVWEMLRKIQKLCSTTMHHQNHNNKKFVAQKSSSLSSTFFTETEFKVYMQYTSHYFTEFVRDFLVDNCLQRIQLCMHISRPLMNSFAKVIGCDNPNNNIIALFSCCIQTKLYVEILKIMFRLPIVTSSHHDGGDVSDSSHLFNNKLLSVFKLMLNQGQCLWQGYVCFCMQHNNHNNNMGHHFLLEKDDDDKKKKKNSFWKLFVLTTPPPPVSSSSLSLTCIELYKEMKRIFLDIDCLFHQKKTTKLLSLFIKNDLHSWIQQKHYYYDLSILFCLENILVSSLMLHDEDNNLTTTHGKILKCQEELTTTKTIIDERMMTTTLDRLLTKKCLCRKQEKDSVGGGYHHHDNDDCVICIEYLKYIYLKLVGTFFMVFFEY